MAKQSKANVVPMNAIPETLFGEAACRFADELGIPVATYALRGERPMTTADARTFLAKGKADGGDFSSAVWLVTSYRMM